MSLAFILSPPRTHKLGDQDMDDSDEIAALLAAEEDDGVPFYQSESELDS